MILHSETVIIITGPCSISRHLTSRVFKEWPLKVLVNETKGGVNVVSTNRSCFEELLLLFFYIDSKNPGSLNREKPSYASEAHKKCGVFLLQCF